MNSTRTISRTIALRPGTVPFRLRRPITELGSLRAPASLDEITREVPLKPSIPEAKERRQLTPLEQQCELMLVGLVLSRVGRLNEMLPHLGGEACGKIEGQLWAAGESAKNVGEGLSPVQEFMARVPYQLFGLLREHCIKLGDSIV